MNGQIIDYYGKIHGAYIHANGKIASKKLIELLDCKSDELILEIGFGSGATLAYLASVFRKTIFHGFETSEQMYLSACGRLRFCKLFKRARLHLILKDQKMAVEENTYDKVYAESVVAIQKGDGLKNMILEIQRILKPNGVFIFNETIWLDSTHAHTASNINTACLKSFGIIQSNANLTHLNDWVSLLTQLGFQIEVLYRVNEINRFKKSKFCLPTLLSNIYTLLGKLKLYFSPSLRREWNMYRHEMTAVMPRNKKLMEGILIKATNRK